MNLKRYITKVKKYQQNLTFKNNEKTLLDGLEGKV